MRGIEIRNLTKTYGKTKALDQISLRLEYGKIYGLLGRNGAGKTTLINILSNMIFADGGEAEIDGEPVRENGKIQEKLFCMREADNYPPGMRIREVFRWTERFYGCFDGEKAGELAEDFGLDRNKKVKDLSTGYRSIFKLAIGLAMQVPYVIFDEPVLGLDANHRELFYKKLLESYEKFPRTMIIATHLIEEVSGLIEEVAVIDRGKILLQDSTEHLLEQGYTIAGSVSDVERYCAGEQVLGYDEMAGMRIAYVLGEVREERLSAGLHLSPMNLQKLFVKLTEKGGKINEG